LQIHVAEESHESKTAQHKISEVLKKKIKNARKGKQGKG